jgi:hypothetical protein
MLRVLLASRDRGRLGPIICICYTNHALDQLLEHLVKANVKQIIRVGGQSKSELLKPVNLKEVTRGMEETPTERSRRHDFHATLGELKKAIRTALDDYETADCADAIYAYLQQHYEDHFTELEALSGPQIDNEGFEIVDYDKRSPILKWLKPQHAPGTPTPLRAETVRSIDELHSQSLLSLSMVERQVLFTHWQEQIRQEKSDHLHECFHQHGRAQRSLRNCFRERDLRCLRQANIIGLTTSGLARNQDLLQRVGSKVLLCEEAGEVLEAHILTAFLPTLEHVILIGDHQQLRPQIQNYDLESTHAAGARYSLDVSLFERLIDPPHPFMPRLEFSTLEVQRRMHSSISRLIRETLYPNLQDHHTVANHPGVPGLGKRLFWLTHQQPEEDKDDAVSKVNVYEVEVVTALVSHLIRQCHYAPDEIAVLTPYLGQLRRLRTRLRSAVEIIVDDRDEIQLQQAGFQSEADVPTPGTMARTNLSQALRLATVDNFQGEEAKVVVVSLVRSNQDKNCGFLRTTNRTNVLLSRAQHGMFIIGDASCYRGQPMWARVIDILEEEDNIGPALPLLCPRHPGNPIMVCVPDDFVRLSPQGGCDRKCADRLSCGHQW